MYQYHSIIIISLFTLMMLQMIGFGIFLRKKKLSMSGKPPINSILFKTAKLAMMLCWLALLIQTFNKFNVSLWQGNVVLSLLTVILFTSGRLLS